MSLKTVTIPGKTFMFGEYAILEGGTCLGIGTKPVFDFDDHAHDKKQIIHEQSPAGRYVKKIQVDAPDLKIDEIDHEQLGVHMHNPYQVGGFGASTAEFLYFYLKYSKVKNIQHCFDTYRSLYEGSREQPSGMDVVTQLCGGLSLNYRSNNLVIHQKIDWSIQGVDFVICSTGLKVKTHEHLAELDRKLCLNLVDLSHQLGSLVRSADRLAFFEGLDLWMQKLKESQLTHPLILDLKQEVEALAKQQGLSFFKCKPCGALGADVVILFYLSDEAAVFRSFFDQNLASRLKIQASLASLQSGPLQV